MSLKMHICKIHTKFYASLCAAGWWTALLLSTLHLSLHEGFVAKITNLILQVSDQLWGCSLANLSDLLQWWQMPDKPLSHDEIHPNCFLLFPLYCFLWHTCKAPSIGAQTGASNRVTNSSPMSGILTNILLTQSIPSHTCGNSAVYAELLL